MLTALSDPVVLLISFIVFTFFYRGAFWHLFTQMEGFPSILFVRFCRPFSIDRKAFEPCKISVFQRLPVLIPISEKVDPANRTFHEAVHAAYTCPFN